MTSVLSNGKSIRSFCQTASTSHDQRADAVVKAQCVVAEMNGSELRQIYSLPRECDTTLEHGARTIAEGPFAENDVFQR